MPHLDKNQLQGLREALQAVSQHDEGSLPRAELTRLAAHAPAGAGLTIDFEAAEQLGQPMVVLRVPQATRPDPRFADLSPREREVAALVARGARNKDIAAELFISVATVKDHVHNILSKTGLSTRAAVAALWKRQ